MTEQGYPPRQPDYPGRGRDRTSQEPRRTGWQMIDAFDDGPDTDSDLPPWAVPGGIEPLRPARRPHRAPEPGQFDEPGPPPAEPDQDGPPSITRRPRRSRAAVTRRRKSKRRLVTWGGTAIVLLILVGVGFVLFQSPAPKSRYVTTLQKGEFKAVPDACKVVGATALRQIMSGTPTSTQPQQGSALSQCAFTVDAKPTFRVLQIKVQAYDASLTVPVGDGSATVDAKYTFAERRRLLAHPLKRTPQPPATITAVSGLGDEAVSAVQVFHTKSVIDLVTVLARYRNVLITVSFQGQASGGFGPVTVSELRSGALTAARAALTQVKGEPTV
ncbi:MAG TPA: hypothetical protein VMU94_11215 [Streptosporangiaceae bacterium]|nr:hypothetical protein [Streptosporangiaceae bacterium]